ncbi:uncharacterized protein LJ264_001879 isoform 2-T2 [Porphyrio hochstetteri]
MNGLGRAGRDARWEARELILSDTGTETGCCGYRSTSSDGSDSRCQHLTAGRRDSSHRTPEEADSRLAAAPPHLTHWLAANVASALPPTAEPGLTDRLGQV